MKEKLEDNCSFIVEEDFLLLLEKNRNKKQKKTTHSHRHKWGRDKDYRKMWRKKKESIDNQVFDDKYSKTKITSNKFIRNYLSEEKNPKRKESQSILNDFLNALRKKGVKVSTPEWLHFITVINKKAKIDNLSELIRNNSLLNKFRLYAKTILIKNKSDETIFHEVFDQYFERIAKILKYELNKDDNLVNSYNLSPWQEKMVTDELSRFFKQREETVDDKSQDDHENAIEPEIKEQLEIDEVDENLDLPEGIDDKSQENRDSAIEPEIKGQLGIDKVDEDLDLSESKEHDDNETIHGGKKDQHNDILKKEDLTKKGGGNKGKPSEDKGKKEIKNDELKNESKPPESPESEQKELTKHGFLVGGGKCKSIFAQQANQQHITHKGKILTEKDIKKRKRQVEKVDKRKRYEARPDKASMREVIRNLRKIITDVSELKNSDVDLKRTVKNFARRDFRFDYKREREKQAEVVLLIDVGGPVNEWSPLMKEVAEEMAKGLSKLEVYLFHNNVYGYIWKPNSKNLLASSYAKPNSLIDLKKVVKKRKKVIIYGDAEMSYSEFQGDGWPPGGNEERVAKFGMGGKESLKFIKKKANSVVWINPVFAKEWKERDDSRTIKSISDIIPMYDLTIGGIEDAIKKLMEK